MIHMVHFASRKTLEPLLRHYGVFPGAWQTWEKAPPWLHKMWEVARREWGRSRKAKGDPKKYEGRLQSWSHYHSGKAGRSSKSTTNQST